MTINFECLWPICEDGYVIETVSGPEKGKGSILTPEGDHRVLKPASNRNSVYDPMAPQRAADAVPRGGEPLLFRTFADLHETEDDVIRFANRFGRLHVGYEEAIQADWFYWIKATRQMIERVEAGVLRSEDWSVGAADFSGGIGGINVGLSPTGKNGGFEMKVKVPTLRAALWGQLGLWIEHPGMNQRKCINPKCGHWHTFGPGTDRRSSAETCGQRECVQWASNQRRKESKK